MYVRYLCIELLKSETYVSISASPFRLNGRRDCCCPLKFMYEPGWMFWLTIQSGHLHGTPVCGTLSGLKLGCCSCWLVINDCCWVDGAVDHGNTFEFGISGSGFTTAVYGWCWFSELEKTDGLLWMKLKRVFVKVWFWNKTKSLLSSTILLAQHIFWTVESIACTYLMNGDEYGSVSWLWLISIGTICGSVVFIVPIEYILLRIIYFMSVFCLAQYRFCRWFFKPISQNKS